MPSPSEAYFNINLPEALRNSGSLTNSAIHDAIRGKNWIGGPAPIAPVQANPGLVLLTKPDLKLTDNNIGAIRQMTPLLTDHPRSVGAAIRDGLDPRSARRPGQNHSELNDPYNAFFSIMDNTLISLEGWPDIQMEKFVSTPGNLGSTWSMAKGSHKPGQNFTLTATHQNVRGNIINLIYTYWVMWQYLVHHGDVSPHSINVRKDKLDYKSRFYRFIFDEPGRHVVEFTMCGDAMPQASSVGAVMNLDATQARNDGYDTISAVWDCNGIYHNDPIVIDEFNRTVQNANPWMRDANREDRMVKLSRNLKAYRGYGYPYIDPRTLEFQVWVPKDIFAIINANDNSQMVLDAIARKFQADYANGLLALSDEERAALFA